MSLSDLSYETEETPETVPTPIAVFDNLAGFSVKYAHPYDIYNVDDDAEFDKIIELVNRARLAVSRTVLCTNEVSRHGNKVSTDNYIKLENDFDVLVRYIWSRNNTRHFVKRDDIPERKRVHMSRKHSNEVVGMLKFHFFRQALMMMLADDTRELWYDEVRGVWQFTQSVIDESTFRPGSIRRLPRNSTPFHGRVRSQAKRSGTPPGTSIGYSRNSAAA